MSSITQAETIYVQDRGGTIRYRYRYTLDNGEVHERNAWVSSAADEATERTFRGNLLLEELAQAEIAAVLNG